MQTTSQTTDSTEETRQDDANRERNQTPEAPKSPIGVATALFFTALSSVWLLNFNMGMAEIPDVFPIVGHIDEAAALIILLRSLQYLGIDVMPLIRKVLNVQKDHGLSDEDLSPGGRPAEKRAHGRDVTGN